MFERTYPKYTVRLDCSDFSGTFTPTLDIPVPVAPVLHDLGVIVKTTNCNKDPTQVIHFNGAWHFWSSNWNCLTGPGGAPPRPFPRAEVHHFYSATSDVRGPWITSGTAVGQGSAGAWDAWSVFTPGAIYDVNAAGGAGLWYLWYGAVTDGKRPTHESIGLVTAPSPFGPWTRSPHNPVFVGPPNGTAWCGEGNTARVDEADAYVIGGRKLLVVKGVCQNFTALPTAWVSSKGPSSFDPPYTPMPGASPMQSAAPTPGRKGFEQARIFPGPDGLLHMTGHDHGDKRCQHFVSDSGGVSAADWRRLPSLPSMGLASNEPTPVFAGVPGDRGGVPTHFIQFASDLEDKKLVVIHLLSVGWANVSGTFTPTLDIPATEDVVVETAPTSPGPQCALRSGDINGATFAIIMAPARGGNNASECCDTCYAQYGNASGFNGTGCRSWAYSHIHKGCWLKADPAPTKYPHNPTDTSGVVIAPTIITGPDTDMDYVCCVFNATALVPDFDKRFPGGLGGRWKSTAPANNLTACVDICASLYYYGCRAASWNSSGKQCFLKTAKGNPTHRYASNPHLTVESR